ncbi:MAG: hypothetical protein C0502_04440 [Opitutus sp.]|nr:hypothetical protein [Opitutus sp.]
MSLINDALKKAQRQRTGDPLSAAPMPGGSAGSGGNRGPAASSGGSKQAALIGGGALLGLVIAGGAFLFFRGGDEPSGAPARPESAPAATPAKSEPAPVATAVKEPEKPPPSVPPPTAVRTEEPKPTVAQISAAMPTHAAPVLTVPIATAPAPQPPAEPARPSTRMVNTIEALRVAGIRAAGNDSKVLMNDRVYRIGDMVDYDQGLRLTAATPNSLTFVDATGATYTRNF